MTQLSWGACYQNCQEGNRALRLAGEQQWQFEATYRKLGR